jgi:FkbM family methyltransferase
MFDAATQEASVRDTFIAILRAIPGSGVFWDVGANIGSFTWYCASTRNDFEIVSFEPDRKNLECLSRTSRAWNLPLHKVIPFAVAEKTGQAVFLVDDVTGTTGTLEESSETFNQLHYGRRPRQSKVDTISLDDFSLRGNSPPTIIKIDVEGAELRVFEGGLDVIDRHRPVLFFETFRYRDEVLTLLGKFGYEFYDSDRRQNFTTTTTNFVGIGARDCPSVAKTLLQLGYPVRM